jgi:hypothetical protein
MVAMLALVSLGRVLAPRKPRVGLSLRERGPRGTGMLAAAAAAIGPTDVGALDWPILGDSVLRLLADGEDIRGSYEPGSATMQG